MNPESVLNQLIQIIGENVGYEPAPDEPLSNYLNSVTFIKVMVAAEKTFAVRFEDEELDNKQFSNLAQLSGFIFNKIRPAD
jgi:acyl carrier protein